MYVRFAALAAAAVLLPACFLLSEEVQSESSAPEAKCGPDQRPRSDGSCAAKCELDEELVDDDCVKCPSGQMAPDGRCEECNDTCDGFRCEQRNACGEICLTPCLVDSNWRRLRQDTVVLEAEDPTCADLEPATPPPEPVRREGACVAWDEPGGRFVIFGGESVSNWIEAKCDPTHERCDTRRSCSLEDTWTVTIDAATKEATIAQLSPQERPERRSEASCVSTPEGVLLFGGRRSHMDASLLSYNATLAEDLWIFRDGEWQRPPHLLGLGAMHTTPAAWDPEQGELVVVGGCDVSDLVPRRICSGRPLDGPLTCVGEEQIEANGYPWPYGASFAWDHVGGRFLLVGGTVYPQQNGDGRGWSCGAGVRPPANGETWELLRGAPGERPWRLRRVATSAIPTGERAAMDGGANELLRIGGIDRGPELARTNDQACLFEAGDWRCNSLTSVGGPAPRDQTTVAHGGGSYLLVGGSGGTGLSRADLWLYVPLGRSP